MTTESDRNTDTNKNIWLQINGIASVLCDSKKPFNLQRFLINFSLKHVDGNTAIVKWSLFLQTEIFIGLV